MDFEGLQKLMRENGIVGAGGAGFPSYAKLNRNVDTLIVNCAECEPLLRLHRQLIEKKSLEVLQTAVKMAEIIGAKEVVVGIKKTYTQAVSNLEEYVKNFPNARLCLLREVYPAGDEVILTYEATKRIVPPGKIPASVGVVVFNVETVYNVYRAMNGKPVTHKWITVSGEVNNPRTFYTPIGSKIYGLIKRSGGSKIENPEILIGGPMMGRLGNDHDVVNKTTNAIILLPRDHQVVLQKRTKVNIDLKRVVAACCQCSYCTDLCPRYLLGHPINPAELMRVISNVDPKDPKPYLNSMFCSGCGVCEMYACQQGLSPRALINAVKNNLRRNGIKAPEVTDVCIANSAREGRRVPLMRLLNRLDLAKYAKAAPMYDDPINAKEVVVNLNQHIGVPAKSIVKEGDIVKEGQVIAVAQDGLSINYHASIDGTVIEVAEKYVVIKK